MQLPAAGARASFPFATEALAGPRVLDTANFPVIRFESTQVTREGPTSAAIDGRITLRGVTRDIRLHAEVYRQTGTEAGDLRQLVILLTGSVSRAEFGADGWSDLVADEVRLRIFASIIAAG